MRAWWDEQPSNLKTIVVAAMCSYYYFKLLKAVIENVLVGNNKSYCLSIIINRYVSGIMNWSNHRVLLSIFNRIVEQKLFSLNDYFSPWLDGKRKIVYDIIKFLLFPFKKMLWSHKIFYFPSLAVILCHLLSVPQFTANLYCICLRIPQIYT